MILRCILNLFNLYYKYTSKILKQIVMQEGINMGRKSPWTKEEYISIYNKVNEYVIKLSMQLLIKEGVDSASEAGVYMMMNKMPIVYLFVHYHYGTFEDLKMKKSDVMAYLTLFLPNVKQFTKELKEGFDTENIFPMDLNNEIAPILSKMCDEIIYIEENF